MLGPIALGKTTLMLREKIITVAVRVIKHTSFIDFIESGKTNDRTILFYIDFLFLFMNSEYAGFFRLGEQTETGESYRHCGIKNEKK